MAPVNPSLGSKAEANTKGLRRERMEFVKSWPIQDSRKVEILKEEIQRLEDMVSSGLARIQRLEHENKKLDDFRMKH